MTDKQTVTIVYTPQAARDWLEQHVVDAQGAVQEFEDENIDDSDADWYEQDLNELEMTHQRLEALFDEAEAADDALGAPCLADLYQERERFMAAVKEADPEVVFPAWVDADG